MFEYIEKKIFGSHDKIILKSLNLVLRKINDIENRISFLSDAQLNFKTKNFKNKLCSGQTFDNIIAESFAVVRETSKRVLNERHYDSQILGGLVLHRGMIAEMKTGEGKTLAASLPIYLNSLTKKGVHVVTVNDYLAKRDSDWMGKIYKFHELTVGCLTSSLTESKRRAVYKNDIIYGTNNEFGFDYLKDNIKYNIDTLIQTKFYFAIIDEVDSILIDESRTPLIISDSFLSNLSLYAKINKIIPFLQKNDYDLDEKDKSVLLTDHGNRAVEILIKNIGLISHDSNLYDIENMHIVHCLNKAMYAHKMLKINYDYIVKNGKALIIDEFTGRITAGRRYAEGLHQAIEAKENISVQEETKILAATTFQNYFRMYSKLAGMTGTAITEAKEFLNIYGLEVVQIPQNIFTTRIDENDAIYKTENSKNKAILKIIKDVHNKLQPILVGTTSVEKSEFISRTLKKNNIKHYILNAKLHEHEASIIAQAGRLGSVTIATSMAGRGTDIKLGGNENSIIKNKYTGKFFTNAEIHLIKYQIKRDRKKVLDMGGLFVMGIERNESRRIDNQLKGRAGRQGDIGKTKFFLSLEDCLIRIFGSVKLPSLLDKIGFKDHQVIEHPWIDKMLEKAQKEIESKNYECRKSLLNFDDVINEQRQAIYMHRIKIMNHPVFYNYTIKKLKTLNQYLVDKLYESNLLDKNIIYEIYKIYSINFIIKKKEKKIKALDRLNCLTIKIFENLIKELGNILCNKILKRIFLITLDKFWRNHICSLDKLKMGINLRSYAQKDPLNEYKFESFQLFKTMLLEIDKSTISTSIKVQIS